MTVTDGRQLRAGRVILGMTIKDMAELAGLHKNSIIRVERYGTLPRHTYAANKIQKALESLGIMFEIKDGRAGLFFTAATIRTKTPYVRK